MDETMPTIDWFETVRRDSPPAPDLLEINSAGGSVLHTRYWYDDELVDWHEGGPPAGSAAPTVVELSWGSADAERRYWTTPFTQPLPGATIRVADHATELDTAPEFLARFAPGQPLPDATFRLEIECAGLTLDPGGTHTYVLDLVDGRPAPPSDAATEPDLTIRSAVDPIMSWLSGERLLTELVADMTVEGEILMLGAVAGALGISGGFVIPTDLAQATHVLVSLVQDHRALLDDCVGVRFS